MSKLINRFGSLPGVKNERPNSYSDTGAELDDAALIGDPETIIMRLKALQEMGFEYVNILLPDDENSLRLFAEEIMPEFDDTIRQQEEVNERALA